MLINRVIHNSVAELAVTSSLVLQVKDLFHMQRPHMLSAIMTANAALQKGGPPYAATHSMLLLWHNLTDEMLPMNWCEMLLSSLNHAVCHNCFE